MCDHLPKVHLAVKQGWAAHHLYKEEIAFKALGYDLKQLFIGASDKWMKEQGFFDADHAKDPKKVEYIQ